LWHILLVSFALAALRFFLIGWGVEYILIIIFAQVLHAASFGSFHAAAVALVHQYFRGKHQAKGQGLYTSISFGLGGTMGGLMSGYAWDPLGSGWTFTLSALLALAGYFVLLWRARYAPSSPDAV
jgi:PPP family 3-phenylpropionic acid transporter